MQSSDHTLQILCFGTLGGCQKRVI